MIGKTVRWKGLISVLLTSALLTACGGGGGGSSSPQDDPGTTTPKSELEGVWVTDCLNRTREDFRVNGSAIEVGLTLHLTSDCSADPSHWRSYFKGVFNTIGTKVLSTGETVTLVQLSYQEFYSVAYGKLYLDALNKEFGRCLGSSTIFREGQPVAMSHCVAGMDLPEKVTEIYMLDGQRLYVSHEDDDNNNSLDYRFGKYYTKQ